MFFFKLINGYTHFTRDIRVQSESEIETKEIVLALFVVFRDGDNFCKAFAGAQVNLSYHEWLHPEKLHFFQKCFHFR